MELNWSSPKALLKSFAKITIGKMLTENENVSFVSESGENGTISSQYKSTMGHAISHVKCVTDSGKIVDRWASFSGQDFEEVDKKNLLKDKIGMGVLFYNFIDGHIIDGEENLKRLLYYKGNHRKNILGEYFQVQPRFIEFEIDSAACDRLDQMINYFVDFNFKKGSDLKTLQQRTEEQTLYFTNVIDPYESYHKRLAKKKEKLGGGCAPFAVALAKEAGVYRSEFEEQFVTSVAVSTRLIGRANSNGLKVSVMDLFFGKLGKSWFHEGYPSVQLNMYDPSKIWDYIGSVQMCLKRGYCETSVNENIKFLGIQLSSDQFLKEYLEVPKSEFTNQESDHGIQFDYQLNEQTIQGLSIPLGQ